MNRRVLIVGFLVVGSIILTAFLKSQVPRTQHPAEEHRTPVRIEPPPESTPGVEEPLPGPDSESLSAPAEPVVFIGAANVTVLDFLRQLRKATGLNIVATGDLSGSVPSSLNGVSWSIALETVLTENKLQADYRRSFLIIRHWPSSPRPGTAFYWSSEPHGRPVALEVTAASPGDVVEVLAKQAKWNLVLDHDVVEPITALGAAPWDEFLEAVLEAGNLNAELAGNSLHVMPFARKPPPTLPITSTRAGVVRCVIGFTMKEGDGAAKRAEYNFEVPTDGSEAVSKQGSRAPVVTAAQLGGPPTVQYIEAFVRIKMAARIGPGLPREGWFVIDGEYTQPLEHAPVLNSKQSLPYLDTVAFNTALGVPENTRLSFAGYKDHVTHREFEVDFSWSTVVPSSRTLPLRVSHEKIVTQATYDIDGKLAHYWVVMGTNLTEGSFLAGTRVPVVTQGQLGGPPTVQFIDSFARLKFAFQPELVLRGEDRSRALIDLDCEYTRLLNRPYATNLDNPYLETRHFTGIIRTHEHQEVLLNQQADSMQSRTSSITFAWWFAKSGVDQTANHSLYGTTSTQDKASARNDGKDKEEEPKRRAAEIETFTLQPARPAGNQTTNPVVSGATSAQDKASADKDGKDQTEEPKKSAAETAKQRSDEWSRKIDAQKREISLLQRELDVLQREQRLRAAAYYGDVGTQMRDSAKFAEDSRREQEEIDAKKKALDAAQNKLVDLDEQARKAHVPRR